MRKTIYMLSFLFTMAMLTSCGNAIKDAEGIGKHAFNTLKKMNTLYLDGYIKNSVSFEKYMEIAKTAIKGMDMEKEVIDKMTKEMDQFTEEQYKKRLEFDFKEIKGDGEELGILWDKIEYKSFDFKEKKQGGINEISGDVLFTQDGKTYKIKVGGAHVDGNFYSGQMGLVEEVK